MSGSDRPRLARIDVDGRRWARVEEEHVVLLSAAPWEGGEPVGERRAREVRWLAPAVPSKIVCVGLNYRAHAEEMGKPLPERPLLFLKPPSALLDPGGTVRLPAASELVHHEAELAAVVGRPLRHASVEEAAHAVAGLCCADDVTARDVQRRERVYTRAKGFDTFLPLGPWLVEGLDPADLGIELRVDGETRQRGRTSDMIFPLPEVLAEISRVMTLLPGDLVLTGTPPGVGPLAAGQRVEIEIEGIGTLRHAVGAGHRSVRR